MNSQGRRGADNGGLPFSGAAGPLQRLVRDQRILFMLVGGANTVASTALFALLIWLFQTRVPATVILVFVWCLSLITVFMIYRRLVFRVRGHFWLDLARFAGVNLVSLGLNAALLGVFADWLGWPAIPVQVVITILVVLLNYFGHLHFSFRRKRRADG